ncbi:UDP-XYL synthase 5 [Actinidia rufa]|uniref:UDP-XYL synthase 5 n=1 Tax=Actinidia rufa TaxID=165716 RepID=A0A7J0GWJ3_9ERIC|nr:UDP-XYL synthase 5 [Actinidia rufa]
MAEVDLIYHLACPASPISTKYNPVKTIKTNVMGMLNMLGLAKRVGARPEATSYPLYSCVRRCYDEGKRVAETLMFDYHRQHGIGNCSLSVQIRTAKIFNTYGPHMNIDDGRVVSNFIAQAICDDLFNLFSCLEHKLGAFVMYLTWLMASFDSWKENILGEFTMLELAETVKENWDIAAHQSQCKDHNCGKHTDDPRQRKPNITKARELLGWEPKGQVGDGVPLMEEDFHQRLGVPKTT